MSDPKFVYVEAQEGHLVTRFGTKTYIGADVVSGKVVFSGAISAIPAKEWGRYLREYTRLLRDGALKKVTEADRDRREQEIDAKQAAAKAAVEAEAKKLEQAAVDAKKAELEQREAAQAKAAAKKAKKTDAGATGEEISK